MRVAAPGADVKSTAIRLLVLAANRGVEQLIHSASIESDRRRARCVELLGRRTA